VARPDRRHQGGARTAIDARVHLAALAGQTVISVLDGVPHRVLGVSRDTVYVLSAAAPLGKPVSIAHVQAAFDRLAAGEEVELSDPALGDDGAFVAAAMLSLPGAELFHGPARVALQAN
jgi:hypothetical protein